MNKVDHKVTLKALYNPKPKEFAVTKIPPLNFLMVDGAGDPNSQAFKDAAQTLYAVAFALKFAVKKHHHSDYTVMPLEGLWWTSDNHFDHAAKNRDNWRWTLMVMQPEVVTADLVQQTIGEVRRKKNPPALDCLRFERYDEGLAVHTLYFGPYSDEHPTIEAMYRFMESCGYAHNGKHHEIYLNDPSRVAPEKMRTILRQPIRHK
jgi:hypothetical protein